MKRKINVTRKDTAENATGEPDERTEEQREAVPEFEGQSTETDEGTAESGAGSAPPADSSAQAVPPVGQASTAAAEGSSAGSAEKGGARAESLSELETIQEEMDRVRDQYLRLAADFENYRKRMSADLGGVWARAQADLVRGLVEGLDDLQRVSQFTSEDTTVETLIEGVDLVERKLLKALTDAGLQVINPLGEAFDPNLMEAMMRVPTDEEGQDETVHQVFQKGYLFKDQLVRPARVSVYMDDD